MRVRRPRGGFMRKRENLEEWKENDEHKRPEHECEGQSIIKPGAILTS